MRYFARTICALAVLAAVGPDGVRAQAQSEDILVGGLFASTGPSSAIGIAQQRGTEYAIALKNESGGIRGRQIKGLYEDTQGRPDRSVLAFNKLTDLSGVQVMLTSYSGATLAIAPLATRKQVLLVNAAAQADNLADASPYLINTIPLLKDETAILADFVLNDLRKKSAVILFENGPAGISGRDGLKAAFTKAGGRIVHEEPVQSGETNFRAALLKTASFEPDVVFVVLTWNVKLFGEQAKQSKLAATIVGTNYFTDPGLVTSDFADGWYSTAIPIDAPDSMTADFKKRYGIDMDIFAREYFNATEVLLKSVERTLAAGEKITGDNVRKNLFAIKKFDGLIPLEFNSNNGTMPISLVKIENRKLNTLRQAKNQ